MKFKVLALGLVTGTPVKVLSVAPLGDPITIEVRGTRICLRKTEASAIQVSQDIHSGPDFEFNSNFQEVMK